MDIKKASIEDLIGQVSGTAPVEENTVKTWIHLVGLHPGQTRVSASQLYWDYVTWWRKYTGEWNNIPTQTAFGREMGKRYKKLNTKRGVVYFVSYIGNDERVDPVGGGGG